MAQDSNLTGVSGSRDGKGVLDPVERVSEIIFGLIMVLTFTGSVSVAEAGREEMRSMLVGAIGCNLAWGIVDAVMFVLTRLVDRQRESGTAPLSRQDLRGAAETFMLVFLCTFPVVVPFLVFQGNAVRALRISNAVAITMLFIGGYALGRSSGLRPVRLGIGMTLVGLVLVAITMALGG